MPGPRVLVAFVASLLSLLVGAAACGAWGPGVDLEGPRIVDASLRRPRSVEVPVRPELVLHFSEPIDPATLTPGSLAIVPWETVGRCDLAPTCTEGSCERGRCQEDPLTSADLSRLDRGEFAATIALGWALGEGPAGPGSALTVWPEEALEPHARYTLALGTAIRDPTGAPLSDEGGARAGWRRDFVTAGPGSSGPEAESLAPAAGEVQVPRNLATVDTRFARPVLEDPMARLELLGSDGVVVPLIDPVRCPGFVEGICLRWRVAGELTRNAVYRPMGGTLRDPEGRAMIPSRASAAWTTGDAFDVEAPALTGLDVVLRGRCVHARVHAAEVVRLRLRVGAAASTITGVGALEVAVHVGDDVVPGAPIEAIIDAEDRAGNRSEAARSLVADAAFDPGLPSLAIAEVLANPAGKEPQQEFVELVDLRREGGLRAITGLRIVDRPWAEIAAAVAGGEAIGAAIPDFATTPGARVVIVGASHDLQATDDPRPPAGALVLRLGGALGSGGLGNAGEPLTLFAVEPAAPIAEYGAPLPSNRGEDQGRSVVLVDPGGCDTPSAWAYHPLGSSSPGGEP